MDRKWCAVLVDELRNKVDAKSNARLYALDVLGAMKQVLLAARVRIGCELVDLEAALSLQARKRTSHQTYAWALAVCQPINWRASWALQCLLYPNHCGAITCHIIST